MKNTARAVAFASIIAWVAAIPAPQSLGADCDADGLGSCVLPLEDDVSACGTQDLDCLCTTLYSMVNCYDQYCPNAELPSQVDTAIRACGSETDVDPNDPTDDGNDDGTIGDDNDDDGTTDAPAPTDDGLTDDGDDSVADPEETGRGGGGIIGGGGASQQDDDDDNSDDGENDDAPNTTTGGSADPTRTQDPVTSSSEAAGAGLIAPVGGLFGAVMAVMAWL